MTDRNADLLKEWHQLCLMVNEGYPVVRDGRVLTQEEVADKIADIRNELYNKGKE